MTELTFANKLYAHLAEGITSGQTIIKIAPGEMGNIWAGFKPGVYLYLTIMNELGQLEIVKVTSVNADNTLTVARGQGGTTARAYYIGSPVSARFVAEQMTFFLQRGVFPSGAYNPNTVTTGNFNGEKFWQTGPAADQKRWWINAGGGDKWRLMTGSIYGNEYQDGEGFIIEDWNEYFDDTFWSALMGSWNVNKWDSLGGQIILSDIGVWTVGFMPSACAVTHNLGLLGKVAELRITNSSGTVDLGYANPYTSGDTLDLTVTEDIGRLYLSNQTDGTDFEVTMIEFLGG